MNPEIPWKVAAYMARVAEALESVGDCDSGHGSYYVQRVAIGFDGEETDYMVGADEFGGYSVQFRDRREDKS